MESNVCINYDPIEELEKSLGFADCQTCKHFLVIYESTGGDPAYGLCEVSPDFNYPFK